MRELYGEGIRWYDLVRTKTWGQRAATYTMRVEEGYSGTDLAPKQVITRSALVDLPNDSYLYLRPIPQGSIDALNMSAAEKASYQNPGYNK